MYHKKLDEPTETLAEWIRNCNDKKKDLRGRKGKKVVLIDEFDWHKSKYKPPIEDIKETEVELEDEPNGPMIAPILQAPNIEQYEKTFAEEDTRMAKNTTLINKLIDEKHSIQDNILKIDTKVVNPIGISDYQVNLLTTQRNAMMVVLNILNLRIADLSVEGD